MLEKKTNFENLQAKDIMCVQPKTMQIDALAYDALQIMEKHNISQLVVTDKEQYKGIIHIHEIIKEGVV
jgi:arabinose-5-phosphate isomerase